MYISFGQIVCLRNEYSAEMKYTKGVLDKLIGIMTSIGYKVRFEKGNFQSGYCVVRSQKIAIINRFYDTKSRINCLLDILSKIHLDQETLSNDQLLLLQESGFQLTNSSKLVA